MNISKTKEDKFQQNSQLLKYQQNLNQQHSQRLIKQRKFAYKVDSNSKLPRIQSGAYLRCKIPMTTRVMHLSPNPNANHNVYNK